MPQVAYDLERFAVREKETPAKRPQVRIAKKERSRRRRQTMRTASVVFMVIVVLGLVCGVIYTQARVAELQSQIASEKNQLAEQQSLNAYLNFQMESSTNMGVVEERAIQLGMRRVDPSQITYIRVEDNTEVQVRESPLAGLFKKTRDGLLSIFDTLFP